MFGFKRGGVVRGPSLRDGEIPAVLKPGVEHRLTSEPQPIADQIMVKCSCGWRHHVSMYRFSTAAERDDQIRQLFNDHVLGREAEKP